MATETRTTNEREDAPTGSADAVSYARALGRIEGQMSILIRNVDEHGRQSREEYRALGAKIDRMGSKIDSVNAGLSARIDSVNAEGLIAKLDRLFYWMLGLFGAIIVTVIGSAIWLGIRLGG